MEYSDPVLEGRFLRRYKRFFADVERDGEVLLAHVPNTGSMLGLKTEGARCLVTQNDDPKRKLKYTLQAVEVGNAWVGVNTHLPNQIVWEAWKESRIATWQKYNFGQREMKINSATRLDFVFWQGGAEASGKDKRVKMEELVPGKTHFVEVKNVTLATDGRAFFPDAVTTRGQKHLRELIQLMELGFSAELLYTVQRQDCSSFQAAHHIDPDYANLLKQAIKKGLVVSPYVCPVDVSGVTLDGNHQLNLHIDK